MSKYSPTEVTRGCRQDSANRTTAEHYTWCDDDLKTARRAGGGDEEYRERDVA